VEVVDAQLHAGLIGPRWAEATPDEVIDATVAAMDAVGVDAALLDEWRGWTPNGGVIPGHTGPGGVRRADYPVSECAVKRYPERFAYVARVERNDPELASLLADLRSRPGRLALRWCPPTEAGESVPFAGGAYSGYFSLAERHEVPVFLLLPGLTRALEQYARAFPNLWLVIDHCGVVFPRLGEAGADRFDGLADVIRLAKYPNVALKWCHAPRMSVEPFPYRDLHEHFARVLDAFGAARVLWAADHLPDPRFGAGFRRVTWAEAVYYLLSDDLLSPHERELVFGGTVRTILRWHR
jgi:predicted TIM-barrel fold metal-dependent hydrolase